jgi:hypothetical protein
MTTIGKTVYSLYNNGKQRCYARQQSKCFLCGPTQGYITRTGLGSFSILGVSNNYEELLTQLYGC